MLEVELYKQRAAFLVEVAFRLEVGGSLGLFGGSGEGKSTVLSCLAGLESPDGGRIVFDGRTLFPPPLPLAERALGYLTQRDYLFPHLTAGDNALFGLERRVRREETDWIEELRERLGLGSVWDIPARKLSGGQARRVALARMMARKPRLVLLDEPFTGLDRHIVRELVQVLVGWQARLKFTLLAVDHQAEVLEQLCPRILVIERGRAVQTGRFPELRARPATPLLASLLAPR